MILFFKLLRKRVLKFKPRGVELPSSLSGEEPPSPFPTLLSKAESPNICLGRGLSRQVYGEPQARPLPAQQLQEKARKPQSMQGPKRGVPRPLMLSSPLAPKRVTRGPGPWWDAQLKPPPAASQGGQQDGLGPWVGGCWGQLLALPVSPSK